MENPSKMDALGLPLFMETTIYPQPMGFITAHSWVAPHCWTSFPKVFNAIFRDGSGQLGKIALCAATSTTK